MSLEKRTGFWRSLWEVLTVAATPGLATQQFLIDWHNSHVEEFYLKPARIAAALTAEYGPVLPRWPTGVMEPGELSDRLDAEYCR